MIQPERIQKLPTRARGIVGEGVSEKPIRLGISACLLGEPVRYDGGHKLDRWLRDVLGEYVAFVPVCPEAECGLGVPRETMHLVGEPEAPRLVTTRTNIDHTKRMQKWAAKRVDELKKEALCGFIFKANSPSSGMARVRIYDRNGVPSKRGVGLFARAFMDRFPLIPVEDDARLHDARIRENFIERIFVYRRWREAAARKTRGALADFHTRHKLLILAHSPKHTRALGKLVGSMKSLSPSGLYEQYHAALMAALALTATPAKNANVLQHTLGYFKKQLAADEKRELLDVIDDYRRGHVPLIVPVTLVNHYVRKYEQPHLAQQVYLHPHPAELQLRNHV